MEETIQTTYKFADDKAIDFLPKIVFALIIFLIFIAIAKLVQLIFFRIDNKFDAGKSHVLKLAASTIKIVIIVLGGITALGTLGINVNALIAGLGLGGFALGFALKDALSNLLSGALILIYHPFSVGDTITATGCKGEVIEVNLRYTILQGDNKVFLIPNSSLFTNTIEVVKK
jgi:small-conductance mechanosensitive channel